MLTKLSDILTSFNSTQFLNAHLPISVTLFDKFTFFNEEQP